MFHQGSLEKLFWRVFSQPAVGRAVVLGIVLAFPLHSSWAGSLPRPDRQWLVRLQQAQQKIAEGQIAEAAPLLEQILSSGQWGYVPVEEEGGLHLPLERAAARLVESLSPEAQATWEAWCAAKAAWQLEEALQHRDSESLRRLLQQYPATRFAAEAALLLAADALDRRQWREAIRWTEKLLQIPTAPTAMKQQALLLAGAAYLAQGQAQQARECFSQLLELNPLAFRIGQQLVPRNASPEQLLEMLRRWMGMPEQTPQKNLSAGVGPHWPIFRGDPARNASVCWNGQVDKLRWRLELEGREELFNPASDRPKNLRFLPGRLPIDQLPVVHPVVVEDLALVRLPTRLIAVDLWTGRQRWEYPWGGDPSFQQGQAQRVLSNGMVVRIPSAQTFLYHQRLFQDAPYGHITADGNRVFLIDDLSLPGTMGWPILPVAVAPAGAWASSLPQQNRLIALDLRKEGKVLWSVGGRSGEDEPALAGAFFLGPPLPLDGVLYILAEQAEQIRLLALRETTGELLWGLEIAVPERTILQDPVRRLAGATPSYADGVLVCPTSAGAVVAVDPWTRSVLWAYETPLADSSLAARRILLLRAIGAVMPSGQQAEEHLSIDSTATLAGPYVLVAPVESDQMFCFQRQTGRLCWQRQIEGFRYVAAVTEGVVLTVGLKTLSGWQLHTGKPAWEELNVPLPEGFRTAGWGFRQGRRYYLPICAKEKSELLVIDIPTGRFERRLALPTKTPIGNLTPAANTLISFSAEAVEAFGPESPTSSSP